MTKPAFGGIQAPRQWNDTADKTLIQDLVFLKHKMDGYIYISIRLTTEFNHDFTIFEMDNQGYIVDGFFEIYVDDIIYIYF